VRSKMSGYIERWVAKYRDGWLSTEVGGSVEMGGSLARWVDQ
jgi:hypothetical protein